MWFAFADCDALNAVHVSNTIDDEFASDILNLVVLSHSTADCQHILAFRTLKRSLACHSRQGSEHALVLAVHKTVVCKHKLWVFLILLSRCVLNCNGERSTCDYEIAFLECHVWSVDSACRDVYRVSANRRLWSRFGIDFRLTRNVVAEHLIAECRVLCTILARSIAWLDCRAILFHADEVLPSVSLSIHILCSCGHIQFAGSGVYAVECRCTCCWRRATFRPQL